MHRLSRSPSTGRARSAQALARAAARDLSEVALDVGHRVVEPAAGAEQLLGGIERAELVQRHAEVVEQHRLARLRLEQLERAARDREEELRHVLRRCAGGGGEALLDQSAAGLVAAVRVVELGGEGEQRPVALQVAGDEARLRTRVESLRRTRARVCCCVCGAGQA
jgi:hypothetical protein